MKTFYVRTMTNWSSEKRQAFAKLIASYHGKCKVVFN